MSQTLSPGATIGILGGGQLGRMLALSAAPLGLNCHVYCPDETSPAFDVCSQFTCASYEDADALDMFAASVDVVTYEFENVPDATAAQLSAQVEVYPDPSILSITQDRVTEKQFLEKIGVDIAPWAKVDSLEDLRASVEKIGRPAILKTRRFGYDGKGQTTIGPDDDLQEAYEAIGAAPAVLEAMVSLECEVSLIGARTHSGAFKAFDVAENLHENHILKTSTVPADIPPSLQVEAFEMGRKIADAFDYVGVLGVELFVTGTGGDVQLLVNEIAPRVHNSGHWTQDACTVSQFEQHIRAIAGWPLGDTARHSDVVMTNLLGDEIETWADLAPEPATSIHIYGKAEARPGRKMGHVNVLSRL
ncbi:MAG: 5-(carboxyamino)imidazole ribonucleotide synthase [Alphaproteobacteria bacterium]|nr:5-(carboxyamino)imidazole ribonucleotide synthase [Alphaproteobacteria bacterium]